MCYLGDKYEMNYLPWTGEVNVIVLSFTSANRHCLCMLFISDLYTDENGRRPFCEISPRPPWQSSPLRTLNGRHSWCLGSLVALSKRTHEEITNNHFEVNPHSGTWQISIRCQPPTSTNCFFSGIVCHQLNSTVRLLSVTPT